jgi:hypothetical protein
LSRSSLNVTHIKTMDENFGERIGHIARIHIQSLSVALMDGRSDPNSNPYASMVDDVPGESLPSA